MSPRARAFLFLFLASTSYGRAHEIARWRGMGRRGDTPPRFLYQPLLMRWVQRPHHASLVLALRHVDAAHRHSRCCYARFLVPSRLNIINSKASIWRPPACDGAPFYYLRRVVRVASLPLRAFLMHWLPQCTEAFFRCSCRLYTSKFCLQVLLGLLCPVKPTSLATTLCTSPHISITGLPPIGVI